MIPVALADASAGLSAISTGASDAGTFLNTAWTLMTGNPYLAVFLGVTMLGAGVGLFRKLRRGA